jgi:sugar phosphate isomerase/epimerase
MNTLSFLTSNYITRPCRYQALQGWAQGIQINNEYFRPLETFAERFGAMLADIRELGFEAVDIWTAHLNWAWATDEHLIIARDLLARHDLHVNSLVGNFGWTRENIIAACKVANTLGASLLSGMTYLLATDRSLLLSLLRDHDVKLGFENHLEKTPVELLRKIAGGSDVIGVTIDTGWFTTQQYSPVQAIQELRDQIVHIHLKDILAPGQHETCLFGKGCVPVEECVYQLRKLKYSGSIGIEHEPVKGDPGADCQTCLAMVRSWLERN